MMTEISSVLGLQLGRIGQWQGQCDLQCVEHQVSVALVLDFIQTV